MKCECDMTHFWWAIMSHICMSHICMSRASNMTHMTRSWHVTWHDSLLVSFYVMYLHVTYLNVMTHVRVMWLTWLSRNMCMRHLSLISRARMSHVTLGEFVCPNIKGSSGSHVTHMTSSWHVYASSFVNVWSSQKLMICRCSTSTMSTCHISKCHISACHISACHISTCRLGEFFHQNIYVSSASSVTHMTSSWHVYATSLALLSLTNESCDSWWVLSHIGVTTWVMCDMWMSHGSWHIS